MMMRKVLHSRPANATHWSVRGVAAHTGISKSTVARYFASPFSHSHALEADTPAFPESPLRVNRSRGLISDGRGDS
jgi:hypothetical protein